MEQFYATKRLSAFTVFRKEDISSGERNRIVNNRKENHIILYFLLLVLSPFAVVTHSGAQTTWNTQNSTTTTNIWSITYGNGRFMGVGPSGMVVSSTDGSTWTTQTIPGNPGLEDVVYAGTQWIAVGDGGVIYTSTNGATWTSRTSGVASTLYGVASNGTLTVAAADNGRLLRSSDGVAWTATSVTAILYSVRYLNGQFIAIGESGKIFTSTDGVTWTSQTSGTTNSLFKVTYGNNQFVVVGQMGTDYSAGFILTSPDGVSWISRTIPAGTGVLTGVAYVSGKFVAVGYEGTIISSTDGVTWTKEASGTTSDFYDVTWGSSKFVAAGASGVIRTQSFSALPLTWLNFDAAKKDKAVELQWTTAAEKNTLDYMVQHSTDGIHWRNIGSIAAAGNSHGEQSYSFVHSAAVDGMNYYRLQQRDIDGKQQYSKVISVAFHAADGFSVMQNPVGNILTLRFPSSVPAGSLVQVVDMVGRVMKQQTINGSENLYSVNVRDLSPGQYLIVISAPGKKETKQFIKQ